MKRNSVTGATIALLWGVALSGWVACQPAIAGMVEISVAASYNRTNYNEESYTWTRRYGASLGYHLSERSQIEISFQDVFDRNKIQGYEDTTFEDQIYSANWVQALTGKNSPIQPYFKVGVGQLNRSASGHYALGSSPPKIVDSVTGVLGAGARVYITRRFAIRMEATSYLTGGSIRTWQDNVGITLGTSIYF